jgi:hypothetical protein
MGAVHKRRNSNISHSIFDSSESEAICLSSLDASSRRRGLGAERAWLMPFMIHCQQPESESAITSLPNHEIDFTSL